MSMPACRNLAFVVVAAVAMPRPVHAQAGNGLSAAERAAVFAAAGATRQKDGRWLICADDPQTSGASIDEVRGRLSQAGASNPAEFERSQYIQVLDTYGSRPGVRV